MIGDWGPLKTTASTPSIMFASITLGIVVGFQVYMRAWPLVAGTITYMFVTCTLHVIDAIRRVGK